MNTVSTIDEVRRALAEPRRAGRRLGLVPTMGAFHEGHLSLMRQARTECDVVVVSLFVNPTQFDDPADLNGYPREPDRDADLAARAGVDYLFTPPVEELYPPGFATTVSVSGVTESLEGQHRGREHFDGVATIVTKLLNVVQPDVAYFGQKDAQQAVVIKRLVADLNLPAAIQVCPTVRDSDGLAMSSRNRRLTPDQRAQARALNRTLAGVREAVIAGQEDPATIRAHALSQLRSAGVEPEYLELVSPDTLESAPVLDGELVDGQLLAVVAARIGDTRLIDNQPISIKRE